MGELLNLADRILLSQVLKSRHPVPGITPKLPPGISKKKVAIRKYNCLPISWKGSEAVQGCLKRSLDYKVGYLEQEELEGLPYVQTLSKFPREQLEAKVVLVRFDAAVLLREEVDRRSVSAVYTIKYLRDSGAKILLVSDWATRKFSKFPDDESVADRLSSILQHKVVVLKRICYGAPLKSEMLMKSDIFLLENLSGLKEEVANCPKFAKLLSLGVDIFVNDTFSVSHKVLASTIGVARFCGASMAGFHFEESLSVLKEVAETSRKPYVAIVGGGNLCDKEGALRFLASRCDGLVFVGMMSFQIMHVLGLPVPANLLEPGAHKAALGIAQLAHDRNIPILYPVDFWCVNDCLQEKAIVPAHGISNYWLPLDLGPASLDKISSLLMNSKKIIWIGPVKFKSSSRDMDMDGSLELARMLHDQTKRHCDVSVMGEIACKAMGKSCSILGYNRIENATVMWEFFKGRKLPGILTLDRAYPFEIDWAAAYADTTKPLAVDIGSGNGLFLLQMASRTMDVNFLGLEINKKLVKRCLHSLHQSGIKNVYFIDCNATSTFRSIVSSYPGKLVLVSIQCPNPDFNNLENRWRMLQRSLVEAVADLLAPNGKVFLQSDIEEVAERMKDLFLKYGKDKITLSNDEYATELNGGLWLEENPFGVRSDWEQHVLNRGDSMYRLMLSRSSGG